MNILELFGNLPFIAFNSPTPMDYYRAGYEQHKKEQDEERQRLAMAKYISEKLKKDKEK